MKKDNLLSIIAIVLSLAAITMCTLCCLGGEKKVTTLLNNNPQIIINALENYEKIAMEEQLKAFEATIKDNKEALINDASSPFVGSEKSKNALVLFYDYSCGYCHKLYPIIKELISQNPDFKFVFKPLMFLGPTSEYAARAVMAANLQGKFYELNDALFAYEGQLTEDKIDELAAKTGVNMEAYRRDIKSSAVEAALDNNSELSGKIRIQGVPTMVLNGKIVQSFSQEEIQKLIDAAKK